MEMNVWMQWMDVIIRWNSMEMNRVQIWHVVQITETAELKDHDRNKSAYFRRSLVLFDVTLH